MNTFVICHPFGNHNSGDINIIEVTISHGAFINMDNNIKEEETKIVMQMIIQAKKLAKKFNIENSGFRLVINTGKSAGQEIKHLHMHLIGGKRLGSMA